MSYREDRIICTFYTKIGACRHGEKCSRKHVKPSSSDTILLPNLYQNPKLNKNDGEELNPKQVQEYFDHFYKDIFLKFALFGEVCSMVVCENDNNHLNGNVYVKFANEDSAYNAVMLLNQEWFGGRPVHCELSPVESFHDANCRAYESSTCNRGDHCNFMHIHKPTPQLKSSLFKSQEKSTLTKQLQLLRGELTGSLENENGQQEAVGEQISKPAETTSTETVEKLFASSIPSHI
ncbi:unnamed protein product [Debaryomyces tyrocola]|nr:unnamed protein product [Debaryomyces tyrocola]